MGRVVLDSSVVIALLNPQDKHHRSVVTYISNAGENEYLISAITLAESVSKPGQSAKSELIVREIQSRVHAVVDLDSDIAMSAGKLRASKDLGLPDALIAATALALEAEVWTTDKKFANNYKPAKYLG